MKTLFLILLLFIFTVDFARFSLAGGPKDCPPRANAELITQIRASLNTFEGIEDRRGLFQLSKNIDLLIDQLEQAYVAKGETAVMEKFDSRSLANFIRDFSHCIQKGYYPKGSFVIADCPDFKVKIRVPATVFLDKDENERNLKALYLFPTETVFDEGAFKKVRLAIQFTANELPTLMSRVYFEFPKNATDAQMNVSRDKMIREIEIVDQIQGIGIVTPPSQFFKSQSSYFWIQEFYPENLETLLKKVKLSFKEQVDIAIRLLKGIVRMHEDENYAHLDIKPANILIKPILEYGKSPKFEVGLSDFGTARKFTESASLLPGTLLYKAPEAIRQTPVSPALDSWALGLVFLDLFIHSDLEKDKLKEQLIKKSLKRGGLSAENALIIGLHKIYSGEDSPDRLFSTVCDSAYLDEVHTLICGLLTPNPKKRWSPALALEYLNSLKENQIQAADQEQE